MPANPQQPDWLSPEAEQQGIQRYVQTIRERWMLIVACVVVCVLAAALYVATADRVYRATADMLVTPVNGDDVTIGLGLIVGSSDPTRDVSTASRYVETITVARRVKAKLGLEETPNQLLNAVRAEPLAGSSVVTVTAEADDPEKASRLANEFAAETVRWRTEELRAQLERTIPALRNRYNQLPETERNSDSGVAARLAGLEALLGVPDPTIRVVNPASPPDGAASPQKKLSLIAGLIAGLVLGVGGAFGLHALDPRLRREDQLRRLFRVPILARIPVESRPKPGALPPDQLAPATFEAYRTLRASLAASLGTDFRTGSVLVTGSSPGEGKSTTAINLAHAFVAAGNKVILIEADVHRPTVGAALGVRPRFGLSSVLIRQVALEDALVTTEQYGPDLQLLLVDRPGLATADRLSLPTARQLIADAERLADYVIVDSPPLTEVVDALPLAQEVQAVLCVARLGRTKLRKLAELGEILVQNELKPVGVALVGVERSGSGYYYAAQSEISERQRAPIAG
jgi:capsular exopolysaccharide synthesis family protein